MDGISAAANIIGVIQVTGSLVKLCGGYIQEVYGAREDIFTLQQAIVGIQGVLQDLQKLLQSDERKSLPTSSQLAGNITNCLSDLQTLKAKLESGKGKKLMSRLGVRALTWPLKRTEVEALCQKLERYKSTFLLSLGVDQTSMMVDVAQDTTRLVQNMDLGKLQGVDAGFDSFSNQYEPECLQGTRSALLEQIMEWAMSPSQKCVFWLNGMAGTGKSTVSRTVARLLNDNDHLGASFFFKRGEGDRGNAKMFFPTLIRQLIFRIPQLQSSVQKALDQDPDIVSKSLQEQFEKLLFQPLLNLDQPEQQRQTVVMVIDALDECEHDRDIRNIIGLLPLLQRVKSVHLQTFLTSRPELPISLGFSEIGDHEHQDLALHEIPKEVTEHDIQIFLQDQFAKIRHKRCISQDWPGDDAIQQLVNVSVPLFISAATMCRYIDISGWEPKSRLQELLKDQAKYVSRMDKTYLPILTRLLDRDCDESERQQLLQEFQDTVGVIIILAVPLSINTLSQFLGIEPDRISSRLDLFRSVLSIPESRDHPVRILHLSFRDYLVQSKMMFHVDEQEKNKDIVNLCLKTMQRHLRKDICSLPSTGTLRADIDPQHIYKCLPPELQYSCHYWIQHVQQSDLSSSELEDIQKFLEKHFLHWVEAMSLLGLMPEVASMLELLCLVISGDDNLELSEFLHDAKRFVLKNRQIADDAPLQLYCAGLIFAPETSIIRVKFESELPTWIAQFPRVRKGWSAELQTLEGHSDAVWSVAFSPDGRLLASGSHDKTIRLWNPTTGTLEQTIASHLDWAWSVAFSPDSCLLASGSSDKTVRLWDLATGTLDRTLVGYSDWVRSVVFSPDGRLLASSSDDAVVWIWDAATGDLKRTLRGHVHAIRSVTFSPDSRLLASSSADYTVRVWDTSTGTLVHTLEGHSDCVQSVAFSPDSQVLASGSYDNSVRLWNVATGTLQQTFKGHSNWVLSVAFSPNGLLLASGSHDNTVRLWDAATGVLQKTLTGHLNSVLSVSFALDSRLLASSSHDKTVRLWDTATDTIEQAVEGHSDYVRSMAFSPDGQLLASSSTDMTVRLWDTTGILKKTFEGHSNAVLSVVFSPDGRLLASGSADSTVRLWEVSTGTLKQTFEGHTNVIRLVAFSPDGELVASGSYDKTVRLWNTARGVLQKTFRAGGMITELEFSQNGSHINTNLGSFHIQSKPEDAVSASPKSDSVICMGRKEWISLNGKPVLWLPPEARPSCSAVKGDKIALGHALGQISTIGFRA